LALLKANESCDVMIWKSRVWISVSELVITAKNLSTLIHQKQVFGPWFRNMITFFQFLYKT